MTVTVRDANGNPLADRVVSLETTGTNNLLAQPFMPTDMNGVVTATLASTKAETKSITVIVDNGPNEMRLVNAVDVDFFADASTISSTLSSLTASTSSDVLANNVTHVTLSVSVRDAHDNPVPGQVIELASTGTGNTLAQALSATNMAGVASGMIASTVAEAKLITAKVNPGASEVPITTVVNLNFIADASTIDAALSSAIISPAFAVAADGTTSTAITVTARDAFGNVVPGQTVAATTTGTDNFLTQPVVQTDVAGQTAAFLATIRAETKVVTCTINPGPDAVVVNQTPSLVFIGDEANISAALSSVVAAPTSSVVADGATVSGMTVIVRDVNGNAVPNQPVVLSSTGGGNTLVQPAAMTNAAGLTTGTLASITAEVKTVTATAGAGANSTVLATAPSITFIGDAMNLDPNLSTIVATPVAGLVADGVSMTLLTVTARDVNSNIVAGQTVQLASNGTGNLLTQPAATTDANGIANGSLSSTVAQAKMITATLNPGPSQVALAAAASVAFVADISTISAGLSSAVLSPAAGVVADGTDSSTLTVTVRDANSNPVAGQIVQFSSTGTGNTLTQPVVVTNASGVVTGSIQSTIAETKTIVVTVNPGPGQVVLSAFPTVDFIGDATTIDAVLSSAVASPSTGVVADGSTVSTLTVTVRDANGNVVPGQSVQIASTGTSNTLTQPVAMTNAAGQTTATVATTNAEIKVVTVTVNPGAGSVVLAQAPSIEFVGDPANISPSLSLAFAAPSMNVTADGVSTSMILASVRDVNNNPVPGVTIQLSTTGTGNTLVQPVTTTDTSGQTTGTIASTNAELKTITVTADPSGTAVVLDQHPTVEFVADTSTISAANSTMVSNPTMGVVADGLETSTLTVTVLDANNNPVPGQTVTFAASGSNNTLTQPASVTDSSGQAVGSIATTLAETKTITATIDPGGTPVVVTSQPTVVFISDASNISPTLSSVTVDIASGLSADDTAIATITVTLVDVLSNPVAGQTVQLAATGSGNTLTQPAMVTDVAGVASGTLSSALAETKTVTATIDPGGLDLLLTDTPTVQFSWVLANTYYIRAGGTDPGGCSGGTSPATAWASFAQAAGCVVAGDTVYVGAGTYSGAIALTTSGTLADPIRFIADTTGVFTGDAGEVLLDGLGANQTVHIDGAAFNQIVGFTVLGAAGVAAPRGGILVEGANALIEGNLVYGNATGITVNGVDDVVLEANRVSNNLGATSDGIVFTSSDNSIARGNLVYNNGRHGMLVETNSASLSAQHNTLHANAADGVHIDSNGNTTTLTNNIVTDNLDDGVELVAGSLITSSNNDVFGSVDQDLLGFVSGAGDISSDPLFIDADGADNQLGGAQAGDDQFQLDDVPVSPAIDAGSANASAILVTDGTSLAEQSTRVDGKLDGTGADAATVNMGFHSRAAGSSLAPLGTGDVRLVASSGPAREAEIFDFDVSLGTWSAANLSPPAGTSAYWNVNAVSPLANSEELIANFSNDGATSDLRLLRWNGTSWSTDWRSSGVATPDANRRGFDLVYETNTAHALVVYSNGSDTPMYQTLVNGDWSGETALPLNDAGGPNPDTNTGVVTWVELVAHPNSNEVTLLFADANDDLVACVWDGSAWVAASATTLDTALKTNPISGEVDNRVFDCAYESTTGDLVVSWGRAAMNGFFWSLRANGTTTWSAPAQEANAPTGGVPHFVDLAAEPGSERIAAGLFVLGDTTERLGLATWNGSSWTDQVELDSQIRDVNDTANGDFAGAVGWVGTSGLAVCVYADDQSATLDWASWSNSGGWEARSDIAVAGKGETVSVQAISYSTQDLVLVLFSDSNADTYAATFDGLTWTLTNSGSAIVNAGVTCGAK